MYRLIRNINRVLPLSEGEAIFSCSLAMGCVANNGVTGTDSTSSKLNKKIENFYYAD